MTCCPPVPPSAGIGSGVVTAPNGPETDIRPGETVECFMARAGNTTGKQDDATLNAENKIENSSVPITRTGSTATVSVQFKLTDGSTRSPTSWSVTGDALPSGVSFSAGGLLSGTFPEVSYGQKFQIQVSANDGAGVIDTRGFAFSPSVNDEGNEIRFISPLPGGIVNSKFGPRVHPITGVQKAHTGIDMKMADRSVRDVVAAADGEVAIPANPDMNGYGLRVHLRHISSSGEHLCTTTYNHLQSIYVSNGQKVMAGQKIGLEGSTGASTGNHLHFECRLPDGKFIDPEPLINGSLTVAGKTLANGDADQTSLSTRTSNAALTPAEVKARSTSCAAFGPTYQQAEPPETTDPTPSPVPGDAFEAAWYFTMTEEVGPHWMTAPQFSPGDAELDAGLHETKAQARKTGYVNTPNYPGGETKFGVAQKPNPRTAVDTMTYAQAKNIGFNNYWKSNKTPCHNKSKLVAIMLFDMNYLHGDGNARKILENSGVVSLPSDGIPKQQADIVALNEARIAFINGIDRPEYKKGWLSRAAKCKAYCESL